MSTRIKYAVTLMAMLALSAAVFSAPAPYEIQKPDFRTFDFEAANPPPEFSAGPGGRLSISPDYAKDGHHALRWDWEDENAELRFHSPEAFRHLTGENPDPIVYDWVTFCNLSAFSSWIFSEKPLEGAMRFELGNSKFYVNMNFSGWGYAALLYGRDLAQFPRAGSDTLVIRPPAGVKQGTVYFDAFAPRRELDVRSVLPSSRMPYVKNRDLNSEELRYLPAAEREAVFNVGGNKVKEAPVLPPLPEKLTAEEDAILTRLRETFLRNYRSAPRISDAELKKLSEIRPAYQLKRNGQFVSGTIRNVPKFYSDLTLAGRALKSGKLDAARQQEMRELINDMADLVIQQGHAAFYVLRTNFIAPLQLLRDELTASGRYQPLLEKIRNIADFSEFYQAKPWGNADVYNTLLFSRLGLIFLDDDPRRQWQDLTVMHRWLDLTSDNGEIMPDGTFTHHRMVYSGYGFPAISPICEVLYLTRGTPFFSEKMYAKARRSLLAMSYYSNPYSPHMFSGRWRRCERFSWSMAEKLALLAQCGKELDRECAARYLAFAELYGKDTPQARAFRDAGLTADPMQGAQALNYAISLIHRNGPLLAVVRGQRDGLFVNEAYANQGGNTMGRYVNYGQLQILGKTPEETGFVMDKGWDFNFWPGTTTRQLPFDALRQHFENIEALTSESFGAAAALNGDGVWAMKLQEELPELDDPLRLGPPRYWLGEKEYRKRCEDSRYDTAFRARKSMFFFGDVIVALGSGITSSDKDAPVVTTLAQNAIGAQSVKPQQGDSWLIDTTGTGFYLGDARPVIRRGFVEKPYFKNWNPRNPEIHNQLVPNAGEMELIYLNHGNAPAAATYRYAMLLRPTEERMRQFAAAMNSDQPPFSVLKQDARAHIVRQNATGVIGYALFESGATGAGPLANVSRPCIALTAQKNGKLELALFNPEFDDRSNASIPRQQNTTTRIKLNGNWQLATPSDLVTPLGNGEFEIINRALIPTTALFTTKL